LLLLLAGPRLQLEIGHLPRKKFHLEVLLHILFVATAAVGGGSVTTNPPSAISRWGNRLLLLHPEHIVPEQARGLALFSSAEVQMSAIAVIICTGLSLPKRPAEGLPHRERLSAHFMSSAPGDVSSNPSNKDSSGDTDSPTGTGRGAAVDVAGHGVVRIPQVISNRNLARSALWIVQLNTVLKSTGESFGTEDRIFSIASSVMASSVVVIPKY
jgi:hypothetical protein